MQAQFAWPVGSENVSALLLGEDQCENLADILQRLVKCLPLAVATFKKGALYDIKTILIAFNDQGKLGVSCF